MQIHKLNLLLLVLIVLLSTGTGIFYFKLQKSKHLSRSVNIQLNDFRSMLDIYDSVHKKDSSYKHRLTTAMDSLNALKATSDSLQLDLATLKEAHDDSIKSFYSAIDLRSILANDKAMVEEDIFAEENAIRSVKDEIDHVKLVDSLMLLATEETGAAIDKIKNRNVVLENIKKDLESRLVTPLQLSELKYDTLLADFALVYPPYALEFFDSDSDGLISMLDMEIDAKLMDIEVGEHVKLYETDILAIVNGHIQLTYGFNQLLRKNVIMVNNSINAVSQETGVIVESNMEMKTTINALNIELDSLKIESEELDDSLSAALDRYEDHRQIMNSKTEEYNQEYNIQLELFEFIGTLQLALIRQKNQSVVEGTEVITSNEITNE